MGQGPHSISQRRRGVKGPSPAELAELRALWGTMPVNDIAHRFNIHPATAYRWAKKAGGSSHIVSHISSGHYSIASLAAALGVGAQKIRCWVDEGWLKNKRAKEAEEEPGKAQYEFSDTGVWRLWVQHPDEVFPHGMTAEQNIWLAGMQRTAHQGRVKAS